MARNIHGRLNRLEKLTLKKNDTEWLAIVKEDGINILLTDTGKNINMTSDQFKKWKKDKPNGKTLKVEWV